MKITQQILFLRSIQVACIVGIGFLGLTALLMVAGAEPFHSGWGGVSGALASTWDAVLSFDVATLLRQWISGALGLAIFAALGACVVLPLSYDARK